MLYQGKTQPSVDGSQQRPVICYVHRPSFFSYGILILNKEGNFDTLSLSLFSFDISNFKDRQF